MGAKILDGKALAKRLQQTLAEEIVDFLQNSGITPHLAVILVGDDPASGVYVKNKRLACERVGVESRLHHFSTDVTQDELLAAVGKLNRDRTVHGILVQLPLPSHIEQRKVLYSVNPLKDVDAFHPENVGRLVQGWPRFLPCTPAAVLRILRENDIPVAGRHVVVLGRSDIVGKPLANMLIKRGDDGDATVTICHSKTLGLPEICQSADIIVAAIGQPRFLRREMVKPGAAIIDVGINRADGRLVGDVDFEKVQEIAGWITPVPGGIGPMTVTMLLQNTLAASRFAVLS